MQQTQLCQDIAVKIDLMKAKEKILHFRFQPQKCFKVQFVGM